MHATIVYLPSGKKKSAHAADDKLCIIELEDQVNHPLSSDEILEFNFMFIEFSPTIEVARRSCMYLRGPDLPHYSIQS